MKGLNKRTKSCLKYKDSPTVTKHAVMLAPIIISCLVAVTLLGVKVATMLNNVQSVLPDGGVS